MTLDTPAFAIVDGALCELDRRGARRVSAQPLGRAIAEFRRGPLCWYVREEPFGLLPGLANLYCLDAGFRVQWIAQWPDLSDPCVEIVDESAGILVAATRSGLLLHVDAITGKLIKAERQLKQAG